MYKMEKKIKLSAKQKDIIKTLREYDCGIMDLNDGYWCTGGHGKLDGRAVESLKRKDLLDPFRTLQLTELGKTINID